MNLLKETKEAIVDSGHVPEDIIFIGSEQSGHSCTWEQYVTIADFHYNAGYGAQEVADDLIIVFKDGTKMWRHECDGSEMWEYGTPFKMPTETFSISRLQVPVDRVGWMSIAEINNMDCGEE